MINSSFVLEDKAIQYLRYLVQAFLHIFTRGSLDLTTRDTYFGSSTPASVPSQPPAGLSSVTKTGDCGSERLRTVYVYFRGFVAVYYLVKSRC
jgi:hypothetical protein